MTVDLQLKYFEDLDQLSRKATQRDEELSQILEGYRACLHGMDFRDAVNYMNDVDFSVAGQVLDRSLVVYSKKIDHLEESMETLYREIIQFKPKNTGSGQNAVDHEEQPEEEDVPISRRRNRARVRECVDDEDFYVIDNQMKNFKPQNIQSSLEKTVTLLDVKLSHCAQVESNKRRVDVRLNKVDDKDKSRLRDWFLNDDFMVVREIFIETSMNDTSRFCMMDSTVCDPDADPRIVVMEPHEVPVDGESINGAVSMMIADDRGELSDACSSESEYECGCHFSGFPDIVAGEPQEHIEAVKLKPGKTTRVPCRTCNSRRPHAEGGTLCKKAEKPTFPPLEAFFQSYVQQTIRRPLLGPLRDKELTEPYQEHMNRVAQLKKKNDFDFANDRGEKSFCGFDEDDLDDVDRCNNSILDLPNDMPPADDADFDLPQPDSLLPSLPDAVPYDEREHISPSDTMTDAEKMERAKDLLVTITNWHDSLRSKIHLAEERGVLNMDSLACKIMDDFPKDKPKISFRELVQDEPKENVARYFLTCLQLANEGNVFIEPADPENSMFLERLHDTRLKKLDEYNPENMQSPVSKKRKIQNVESRKRRHH